MTRKQPTSNVKCDHCGKRFTKKRPHQRFDTAECRMADWAEQHPRVGINREGK